MATAHFCGMTPFLSPGNSSAIWNMKGSSYTHMKSLPVFVKGASMENSFGFKDVNPLMELRNQIMKFRDIIDLPPCDGSASAHELVMGTIEDIQNHYPEITPRIQYAEMKGISFEQDLSSLCKTLKSIGESWMLNCDGREKPEYVLSSFKKNINSENHVETASEILGCLIAMARERFDRMDEDGEKNELSSRQNSFNEITPPESFSDSNPSSLSSSPTSVLPHYQNKSAKVKENVHNISHNSSHLLLSLRVQAVGKLNPINFKRLSSHDILDTPEPASIQQVRRNDVNESLAVLNKTSIKEEKKKENYGEEDNHAASNVAKPSSEVTVPTPRPPPPLPKMVEAKGSAPLPPPPPPKMVEVKGSAPLPPPPPMPGKNGAAPPPPPPFGAAKSSPMPGKNGAGPPPPPPLGATKSLRAKATKLKRSSHMGNLYRTLKGKVEGSPQNGKSSAGRKGGVASSTSGKQGMAEALAEMTKRSAYFQKIEEDAQNYAKAITELKSKVTSFQSKDMNELLKFHKDVESVLEHLTDESQVLARFEEFPIKKLETLRTASALYSKLNAIIVELQNWKIVAPLGAVLDKVERYFNKIKGELDTLERTKDEESKKFQSQNIHFDFSILVKIKELMVDVSSSCMELALKERREAKVIETERNGSKREKGKQGCGKMLWRAFQFAFRVYTFAGGHDDRADKLTRELAHEIETDPHHHST